MFSINSPTSVRSSLLVSGPSITQQAFSRYNSSKNSEPQQPLYVLLDELDIKESSGLQQIDLTKKSTSQDQSRKLINASAANNLIQPIAIAETLRTTGPIAGRIIHVQNGDISAGFRKLKSLVNNNSIRFESQQQRFHKKPGKVLEEKRIRRKKKLFNEGVRRLMNLVKEAKRRGY